MQYTTTSKSDLARFVKRYRAEIIFYGVLGCVGLLVLYYAFTFVIWLVTESPQQRVQRESTERYYVWKNALSKHVDMCIKKNGKSHFGPMIGFAAIGSGGCGMGGRYNGVACTWDNKFQENLKVMWDEAHARKACVVWEPSRVTWRGADRMYSGVIAHADDNVGKTIAIAFKPKKFE